MTDRNLGAIILAAGKGRRMNAKRNNKVTFTLANKPLVKHSVDLLENLHFDSIIVVVGFAKNSVMEVLKDDKHIIFAEQAKRLGTAHAVLCGLRKVPEGITDVLVIQGDDSAFYTPETISELAKKHIESEAAVTFLTVEIANPFGLGRIVRDETGNVANIVEEKEATDEQKQISEINAACYFFSVEFLQNYLKKVRKQETTGEYYLVSLIELANQHNQKIETIKSNIPWRGVNTQEELVEAEKLITSVQT